VWKYILKNRQVALKCMSLRVVDGKTTSLWYDPWYNGGLLLNKLGREAILRTRSENITSGRIIEGGDGNGMRLVFYSKLDQALMKFQFSQTMIRTIGIGRVRLMASIGSERFGSWLEPNTLPSHGLKSCGTKYTFRKWLSVYTRQ